MSPATSTSPATSVRIRNLTPHAIQVFQPVAFLNLEQTGLSNWVADGVEGDPIFQVASEGMARIKTSTVEDDAIQVEGGEIPVVRTTYGEATGIPEDVLSTDILVVSLPMQSMARASGHINASQMVAPYKVVRLRSDTSKVLGCTGLTF